MYACINQVLILGINGSKLEECKSNKWIMCMNDIEEFLQFAKRNRGDINGR